MVAKAREMMSRKATVTLPSDTRILITRDFDAPRHLVYRAWTTPELIKRWWHANRGEATLADVDLQVGGKWRWVMVTHAGHEVAFHGVYREIVPDEKIVYTEVFEGVPGGDDFPVVVSVTLAERNGITRLTEVVQCPSREVRDMIIQSGMEPGMQDAMDLLEQVARSLSR
jgi:uncharacterized protein YndB with AHSA1/START domain